MEHRYDFFWWRRSLRFCYFDKPEFKKNDRVMTPEGEGVVIYFNERFNDYAVGFEHSTNNFKPEQLRLVKELAAQELQVRDSVFIKLWPHTDRLGPYSIERIEGEYAKVEGFEKLISLTDLRKA